MVEPSKKYGQLLSPLRTPYMNVRSKTHTEIKTPDMHTILNMKHLRAATSFFHCSSFLLRLDGHLVRKVIIT